jgi:hypothetical protein
VWDESKLKDLLEYLGVGVGLLLTLCAGGGSRFFLKRSVRARVPDKVKLSAADEDGGSRQLGLLELLLFFVSFWLEQYTIAAGWLAFKVAAKWASWQHIANIPEHQVRDDVYIGLHDRLRLSNNLLGSFLNGTLYNIFCAGIGVITAKIIKKHGFDLWEEFLHRNLLLPILVAVIFILTIVYTLYYLFRSAPDQA